MYIPEAEKVLLAASELSKYLDEVLVKYGVKEENGEEVVSSLLHVLSSKKGLPLSDS